MPKKHFAADFRAEKSQEGLRRKTNDRRCPIFFCVTSEPETRVKESSACQKDDRTGEFNYEPS